MKKTKRPGDNISLKTKKSEHAAIMEWLNSQTNLMDSLRYLIEKEILQNGVRNLQAVIPSERAFSLNGENAENPTPTENAVWMATANETAASTEHAEDEEDVIEDDIDEEDIESWT